MGDVLLNLYGKDAMIKQPAANGKAVSVTFELPASVPASTAVLCGEFNQWSASAHPLARTADGRLQATLELPAGRAWRFRYVLDGERWENDWEADGYVPNEFGADDSVVDLTDVPAKKPRRPSRSASADKTTAKKTRKAASAAKAVDSSESTDGSGH
jgi:1,4-alpha-glucan branching enzyme